LLPHSANRIETTEGEEKQKCPIGFIHLEGKTRANSEHAYKIFHLCTILLYNIHNHPVAQKSTAIAMAR